MGHSAVHEHLQTLRRWYKVKRREAPPSQPTCSSGALWSVGCFGCANSRLSSVITQKQMCAKYWTLPSTPIRPSFRCSFHFTPSSLFREKSYPLLQTLQTFFLQLSTNMRLPFNLPVSQKINIVMPPLKKGSITIFYSLVYYISLGCGGSLSALFAN